MTTHKSINMINSITRGNKRLFACSTTLELQIDISPENLLSAAAEPKDRSEESCHWRELELCCVGAASLFQNPNGIPMSDVEFKRQCEQLDDSAQCYEDFGDRCLTRGQYGISRLFGSELFHMEREFCQNKSSELRLNYMKNAACFRSVQKKHQRECVQDFQVALEPIHKLGVAERVPVGCCSMNRFKDCVMSRVEDECGEQAADLLSSWLERAFGNVLNIWCRNYNPSTGNCDSVLPKTGTKPYNGRNTSAISRVISSYLGIVFNN